LKSFPEETKDKLWDFVSRYFNGERLSPKIFKTFRIDGKHKILEFKVKDNAGNWRAIAVYKGPQLVFIYAFHKKSQELLAHDKEAIRNRIRRLE